MFSVIVLMTLCIVDGGFAGFGAAAGRKSTIRKWHSGYYPKAILRGILYSATTLAFPISTALLLMATTGQSVQELLGNFVTAAQPMMRLLGLFTGVVLLVFIPWRITGYEWRTFISVTVFGPLTLVRPFVVLFALSLGLRGSESVATTSLLLVGTVAVMSTGPLLNRHYRPSSMLSNE